MTFTNVPPYAITEGTSSSTTQYLFTYSILDPGTDNVTAATTSCGPQGTKVAGSDTHTNTAGSFKCTFAAAFLADGPNSTQVSANATDDDGLTGATATQTVTVLNSVPVVTMLMRDRCRPGSTSATVRLSML